jgi:5-methylthioadenosine/S-adenosylhomocysteine deaminase
MSILLKNGTIVTMNPKREIICADVLVKDNLIVEIGTDMKADETIDCTGKTIMPGFINTHCHAAMWILPQIGGMPVKQWLEEKVWPLESKMQDNDFYIGTKASCIEMLESGITSFADMYFNTSNVIRGIQETGMRAFVGPTTIGPMPNGYCNTEKSEKEFLSITPSSTIHRIINTHAPYTCSRETLLFTKALADKYKTQIHIHVSENEQEVKDILEKYKMRPVEWLEEIGFLSENVVFDHAIHLNDKEIQIIKKHNIKISHCPVSNTILNSGVIRLHDLLNANIPVSLGTDSRCSNNELNMFHEMKKAIEIQTEKPLPQTIVEMATINGARTLQVEKELGSIETGKKADLIVLDTAPTYQNIVSANKENISLVMCDGKILIHDNKFTSLDPAEVYTEAKKAGQALLER